MVVSHVAPGPPRRGRRQIAPGPQSLKGLITLSASRSGDPHKVNQQLFPIVDFYALKIFCSLRYQVISSFSFAPRPLKSLGGPAWGNDKS